MKKTMAKVITGLVIAAVIVIGACVWTMAHLEITTDGDGDGTTCEYIAPMKYEQKTK